jgi:hypothetical protein
LLSDASTRTSGLAQDEKAFTAKVSGFTQFRYNWNNRGDDDLDEDNTIGFQNAKTKINVGGNIVNENWSYGILFKFEDSGSGQAVLDDAFGQYKMGNGWSIKFGQFKLPLYREELMSDTAQLFANRSVTNSVFTQSRSQGIQAAYEGDTFRFYGAFSDGLATRNTDFTAATEADFAFTARGEYKWAGSWNQAKDFTSFQNSDFFGMVGAAAHWQSGGDTFATAETDIWAVTADVSVEGNGWNVFGYIAYSGVDPEGGDSLNNWGALVQGGIFVAPQWELIAGWDIVIPDSDAANDDNFNTIRIGANHYFVPESHAIKLTIDLSWFLDTQGDSIAPASTATGLLASGDDSQFNLRAQMQLAF